MNAYVIIFVIAIILGVSATSLGYLNNIGKSFQNNQPNTSTQATSLKDQQKQQAQDAEKDRRAYMENVKQKMRDNQRR